MLSDDPSLPFRLPSALDLDAAEALCRGLVVRLEAGGIDVDGAAVERAGTPCLQVLAAAAVAARGRGLGFRLLHPSAALAAAIADLGLHAAIPLET